MLRLKNATDFERVRRDGRSHAHPLVVLLACPHPHSSLPDQASSLPTRIGFTAGKRVGTAVARNRAKRLLREAARARYPQITPGWDLVFIARAPLANVKLPEAQTAVDNLLQHARVLRMADF